jgi:hypothetical protein
MSALGQKRIYAVQQVMSALPLKATAKADIGEVNSVSNLAMRRPPAASERQIPR